MPTLASLKDRYKETKERIARAAERSGRSAGSVVLVAVTKTAEPDQIRDLIRLGHADFGESRVQQLVQRATIIDEWMQRHKTIPGVPWAKTRGGPEEDPWVPAAPTGKKGKAAAVAAPPQTAAGKIPEAIRWHMIGHLQRNKARKVIDLCRLIHSMDSLRLAEEVQALAFKRDQPVEVLMQVNCSGEKSKFGCAIAAAQHLADQIETMIHVKLRGLMTMAPLSSNPEDARATFGRCRELFEEMQNDADRSKFNILCMGMSGDFEVGIEEGANMVRVGTAIFGEAKVVAGEEEEEED